MRRSKLEPLAFRVSRFVVVAAIAVATLSQGAAMQNDKNTNCENPEMRVDNPNTNAYREAVKARLMAEGYPERLVRLLDQEHCIYCIRIASQSFAIRIEYAPDRGPLTKDGGHLTMTQYEWNPVREREAREDMRSGRATGFRIFNTMTRCGCCGEFIFPSDWSDWNDDLDMNDGMALKYEDPRFLGPDPDDLQNVPPSWLEKIPPPRVFTKPARRYVEVTCPECLDLARQLNSHFDAIDTLYNAKIALHLELDDAERTRVERQNEITRLQMLNGTRPKPEYSAQIEPLVEQNNALEKQISDWTDDLIELDEKIKGEQAAIDALLAQLTACLNNCKPPTTAITTGNSNAVATNTPPTANGSGAGNTAVATGNSTSTATATGNNASTTAPAGPTSPATPPASSTTNAAGGGGTPAVDDTGSSCDSDPGFCVSERECPYSSCVDIPDMCIMEPDMCSAPRSVRIEITIQIMFSGAPARMVIRIEQRPSPPGDLGAALGRIGRGIGDLLFPALAAQADRGLMASIVSNGASQGPAFTLQVLDPKGTVRNIALPEGVALEPLRAGSAQPVTARAGGGTVRSIPFGGYCLEFEKQPPMAGTLYRIAPAAVQAKYRPLRYVLQSAQRLAAQGRLTPDSQDVTGYVDTIKQYALWTKLERWDAKKFTDAFVERTKKNFELMKQNWTRPIEDAVRGVAPRRWQDITRVIEDADRVEKQFAARR